MRLWPWVSRIHNNTQLIYVTAEIPLPTHHSDRKTNSTLCRLVAVTPDVNTTGSSGTGVPQITATSSMGDDEWQPQIPSAGRFKSKSHATSIASSLSKLSQASSDPNLKRTIHLAQDVNTHQQGQGLSVIV